MPNYHHKADYEKLDPRAFLRTESLLWVINSKNPRAPLMKGHILIPVRFYDFCYQKCRPEYVMGEQCVRMNLQFWENINKAKYQKNPPEYQGSLYVNTPSILEPHKGYYEEAKRIKGFSLDKNNYLPRY